MVRNHTPSLGVLQGDGIGVLAAYRGWVFPQRACDLRGETLGAAEGGPFFGDDGDFVAFVEEDPCRRKANDAAADDQNVWGGCGRSV